eukprot:scaffold176162_cov30-Tisochrysis_lutea.AAC.3
MCSWDPAQLARHFEHDWIRRTKGARSDLSIITNKRRVVDEFAERVDTLKNHALLPSIQCLPSHLRRQELAVHLARKVEAKRGVSSNPGTERGSLCSVLSLSRCKQRRTHRRVQPSAWATWPLLE